MRSSIDERGSFNSLSRDHLIPRRTHRGRTARNFQLPFSGSHLFLIAENFGQPSELSTPFLGITHETPRAPRRRRGRRLSTPFLGITLRAGVIGLGYMSLSFNSLSRDHRARFRDFPALRGFLPRHPFAQMILKATI